MKICYLGAGSWGFCLASLLASKGNEVALWTKRDDFAKLLAKTRKHPKLPHFEAHKAVIPTSDLEEAFENADIIVESVTSAGIRPVFEQIHTFGKANCPIIITSKGIEQDSCLLLPEVILDVMGPSHRKFVGCLSGPSHAEEVIEKLPTSVVCSAYEPEIMHEIHDLFSTSFLRVYPNSDINGVAFGGAMKNIIAIACGISDGLGFGDNTKAALMTRGLHEIRKLSVTKEAKSETLNGLSGLGDLCVTCLSKHSRNYKFGHLIAERESPEEAQKSVGMVVEGAYTCVAALQLAKKAGIPVPITEAVYAILYEKMNPRDAVKSLLQRAIKEEHL
ncbi:MAG TPA: NAD(P)H-dependent glycerol-3-phosphate dehydrogenase [Rhabdochlamydiaceae bacterium]|jgi:glycerol-3-phosphate dehydrogenase (NAD(P)+)|nr:NAD(P)H-dependent glycerol-3-phosphate dehydrogenase [Rhabdochlamydiaceae bacterium]